MPEPECSRSAAGVRTLGAVRTVEVLGPVRVGGAQLTSPTQVVLVCVLAAAAPDAVPFARLIDAVWDDPPDSAENSLHSHLSRLRRTLGPGSIVREGAAYRLASPTDAERFLTVVDEPGDIDPVERRRALSDALDLWRGPPYGDGSDHRFLRASAEALAVAYGRAVREVAALDLSRGDPLAAVTALQSLVQAQPLDETGWALLVEALDASGRRADALRAVQEAVRTLRDVGLEPSNPLRDVEAMVLRAPASRGGADLPRPAGPFVGRTSLVDRVVALIGEPGWVTLVGPGGVGKTRLAVETVGRVDAPVVFCDLTEADPDDVEITVARAAGVPRRPPYVDRIATRLAEPGTILVLDCCEAAATAVAALGARLRQRCPDLRVVATSRVRTGVADERLVELEPLDRTAAVELLETRVVQAGMAPPPREVLDRLCRAADRLPLTIEMVAGALRSLAPDELMGALDDPLHVLGGPDGDLASSVARSLDLLDRRDRVAFERLSLFRGPFVLETARDVAAAEDDPLDFVDRLRSLRDRSLVVTADTGTGRRLRILDTVRAVGRAELERRGDRGAAEERFVRAFRDRAEQIDAGLRTPDEVRWAAIADAEVVDLRAAHRRGVRHGDRDAAMSIAASMFHLVYDRVRPEIAGWADETIGTLGVEHPLAARVLAVAALGAMHTDRHDRARDDVERARAGRGGPTHHVELVAANLALRTGDLATAAATAASTVAAAERAADPYTAVIGHVLHGLAVGYGGDLEHALEIAAEARRIGHGVGAPTLLAYTDYLEGELLSETEPEVALELLHRAHERASASGSALAEGISLVTITSLRARSVDPSGADDAFRSALCHWRDRGDWNRQWVTLRNLAEFLARSERETDAAVILGAVDAHGPSAYGTEALRLDRARDAIRERLGTGTFDRLRARGRSLTKHELLDHALDAAGPPDRPEPPRATGSGRADRSHAPDSSP